MVMVKQSPTTQCQHTIILNRNQSSFELDCFRIEQIIVRVGYNEMSSYKMEFQGESLLFHVFFFRLMIPFQALFHEPGFIKLNLLRCW